MALFLDMFRRKVTRQKIQVERSDETQEQRNTGQTNSEEKVL